VSGVCAAYVDIQLASHNFANLLANNDYFTSASTGRVQILHKPSGGGVKMCYVLLNAQFEPAYGHGAANSSYQRDPGDLLLKPVDVIDYDNGVSGRMGYVAIPSGSSLFAAGPAADVAGIYGGCVQAVLAPYVDSGQMDGAILGFRVDHAVYDSDTLTHSISTTKYEGWERIIRNYSYTTARPEMNVCVPWQMYLDDNDAPAPIVTSTVETRVLSASCTSQLIRLADE